MLKFIQWIIGLFTRKPTLPPSLPPQPPIPQPLAIPHPEEPPDTNATVATTDMGKVLQDFFITYEVPEKFWSFWQTVKFVVDPDYQYTAATSAQTMTMWIQPQFANPGVMAHELCHVSWNMLTDAERIKFDWNFAESLVGDALVMLLDRQNSYMNTSNIEGHAELFRFLGNAMPAELFQYYPKLIDRRTT
jgi:hypothetical protein